MNVFIFCILSVASCLARSPSLLVNVELNDEWETFKLNFQRKYDPLTEISRRLIWEQNLKYIQQHNLEYDLGKHTYYLGVNQFSDMTHEEFRVKYLSLKPVQNNISNPVFMPPENFESIPSQIDWRKKGYVTEGQCGSCWAFSAIGSLEGQHFRKNKKLISLSEQQLVDCSKSFNNNGCNGGFMDKAFLYTKQYGIEEESDYPYTARERQCEYDKDKVVAHCVGFRDIKRGSERDLASAVASNGPISVGIDASHRSFQSYKGGIYDEKGCSSNKLDHAVLVVGYDFEGNNKYWIVKNSWGTSWGLNGYIKMTKDKGNQCGIASEASFPLV